MEKTKDAQILHFGKIYENEYGNLVFDSFIIEGANRFNNTTVALLTLAKERIEEELAKGLEA